MASSSSSCASSAPVRPAACIANPCPGAFHDAEQRLAETRDDLRAVARKLSSCEDALEGRGAYLGITDAVREAECCCKKKEKKTLTLLRLLLLLVPLLLAAGWLLVIV